MQNPKVNIVLAVYNGEKHLQKQLDSLLAQTYENIDIYIRDDGSTDHSVSFIQDYMQKHTDSKKNMILLENGEKNLRCPGSFYEILRKCQPAEYYSFCDQDDYWYPEKIQWAVEKLAEVPTDIPALYFSACDYQTETGEKIRTSPVQPEHMKLHQVLYYTPGSGFTIVLNELARQQFLLDVEPSEELHDRWFLRSATCFGRVIYDARSTAAHIRHEEAVTANDSDNSGLLKQFIFHELLGPEAQKDKKYLASFLKTYESRLTQTQKKTLSLFASRKKSPLLWLRKVFYHKRLRQRLPGEIALRILFFLGRI